MQPDPRFPKLAEYLRSLKLADHELLNAVTAAGDDMGLPRAKADQAQHATHASGADPDAQRLWDQARGRSQG